MKKIILVLLSLMVLPAFADVNYGKGFYLGGSLGNIEGDYEATSLEFLSGYKFSPFIGAEVRLGTIESDMNYISALYRVESANAVAKSYLIAGYTYNDLSSDLGGGHLSGGTLGGGVGFVIFNTLNLNFEYKTFRDNSDDFEIDTFSVGLDYRF